MGSAGPTQFSQLCLPRTLGTARRGNCCAASSPSRRSWDAGQRGAGGERYIDIDILILGESVIETRELQIPHPQLANRRFVCQPLADLCPQLLVPGLGESVSALANKLAAAETPGCMARARTT